MYLTPKAYPKRAFQSVRTATNSAFCLAILILSSVQIHAQRFVKVVDTIDQLVRLNPNDVHTNVFVADPERGGTFTLAPRTATNRGTVFASTNATKQWNRQYVGAISPLWFGASSNLADNSVPIQAAWEYVRTNKGQIAFPPAYHFPMTNVLLLEHTVSEPAQQKLLFNYNGAHLDWSASPLTNGYLMKIGGATFNNLAELGIIEIENLHITGPEPETPVNTGITSNQTEVVGLVLASVLQATTKNVLIRKCWKGMWVVGAFPGTHYSMRTRDSFIGLHLDDYAINQTFINFEAHQCGYGVLLRPSDQEKVIENILFLTPRVEQCKVGFTVDQRSNGTTDSGVKSLTIINPYFAQNTWDHLRLGLEFTYSTPQTPGADANKRITSTTLLGGKWSGPYSATNKPIRFNSIARVNGGFISVPVNESDMVNYATSRSNLWIFPMTDQDNPSVSNFKLPSGSSLYAIDGKIMVGTPGDPDARIHVKEESNGSETYIRVQDTDVNAGSVLPFVDFWGPSTRLGKFGINDINGFLFRDASDVTMVRLSPLGHLLWQNDNEDDIGAVGATRPRSIYVGTDVRVGALTPSRVVVSDADRDLASSAITSTELGYLTGLGTNVVTHLQLKQDAFTTGNGVTNIANVLSGTYQPGTNVVFVTNSTGVQINTSATLTDTDGYTLLPLVTTTDATVTPIFTNAVAANVLATVIYEAQAIESSSGVAASWVFRRHTSLNEAGALSTVGGGGLDPVPNDYDGDSDDYAISAAIVGQTIVFSVANGEASGTVRWKMRYRVQTHTF